jgi:hypothetical protein
MRSLYLLPVFAVLAILLILHASDAGEGKKKVIKPTKQWSGKKSQNELAKIVHPSGMITNQKAFDALWSGWMLEGKAPTVDFTKQIVFVQLAPGGPNVPRPTYTLDAKDNLTVRSISTLIGGPGFGYSIDALNREGIKTYQGKPLEESK